MKQKCILSMRVARYLLAHGFRIVDVEPSRKFHGEVVFIFEDTPELTAELAKLSQAGN
ncbi:DUF5659 domain-containing protein [Fictibacillus sp. Mic-4]|uniref:DUF5659 domain-containing protein n=1 Tax=Fictibacillus sp. Mic-4 TaxID=3132826 RepID=UPI003CE7D446